MQTETGIAPGGYRLPSSTHIGRVRLQVHDLERSIAYYEKVLGMTVLDRSGGSALLGGAEEKRVLLELRANPSARPVPRRGLLGLYHFAVLLPDRGALGSFIVHLSENGVRAGMSDHLVSEAVYLTDPDGLGIEVYADRPRDGWVTVDRQLSMTTKPLDVDSIIEAAAGRKWNGLPSGTTIGHVHLHVGDIDEASAFYHDAVGFDKIVWSYPGALFMSAGGYHHHLGVNTWATGAPPASADDARLLDWELVLPDQESVDVAGQSITNAGFTAERDEEGLRATDPWGIVLRVRTER